MIDQEFVKYIVSSLVSNPDKVKVDRIMDERGVLLTLHVDEEDLGRVIGRKGSTAQSLRVLLRALGSKNDAHYNLRIADNKEHGSLEERDQNRPASEEEGSSDQAQPDSVEDSVADFAQEEPAAAVVQEDEEDEEDDSLLDKTRRELDDLNDLDI